MKSWMIALVALGAIVTTPIALAVGACCADAPCCKGQSECCK